MCTNIIYGSRLHHIVNSEVNKYPGFLIPRGTLFESHYTAVILWDKVNIIICFMVRSLLDDIILYADQRHNILKRLQLNGNHEFEYEKKNMFKYNTL